MRIKLKLSTRLVVVAFSGLLITNALAQNLITNPGFETPSQGSSYTSYGTTSTAITGWTVDTTPGDGVSLFSPAACATYGIANDGGQILQLCGVSYTTGGGVHQTITTVSNQTYIISIAVAYRTAASSGNFSFGGQNHALSASTTSYVTNTWTVTATNTSPVIDITGSTSSSANQLLIDNVSVTPALDPGIATQPASQTVQSGQTATFSVTATGTSPFSYQWQVTNSATGGFTNLVNGGQIAGANTNVLTISNASTNNLQFYQVIVTNLNGSITSSPAGLVVKTSVLIDVDIGSGAVQTGAAVLGAAGDVWNGVTTGTSTITDSTGINLSGVGYAVAGYSGFNDQPAGSPHAVMDAATTALMRDCVYGQNATFTVSLTGLNAYLKDTFTLVVYGSVGDPNQGDNLTLSGATGGNTASTLTTTGASRQISAGIGVAYQTFSGTLTNGTLTITCANNGNTYGGVNGLQLQIQIPNPGIATQPVSQTNLTGATVAFSVVPSGNSPFGYQWQANGGSGYTNLTDGGIVSGSGTSTLTLNGVTSNTALNYQVIVTNSYGAVTSSPASLTVIAPALIDVDVGSGPVQTGAAVLGTASDVAWNSYSSVNASSLSNLHDSGNNTLTGVGLNVSTGYAYGNDTTAGTLDAATTPLMQDFLFNTGTLTTSVTGLGAYINYPYTLVVYAAGTTYSGTQAALVTVTAGSAGTTPASGVCTSTSRKISAGVGVAYQTFTGILTNSTLTFALTQASTGGVNLNGLQLQFSPLLITAQPVSQTASQGGTAMFAVGAVGTGTLNYQWQVTNSGTATFVSLTDGGQISGSQTSTLSIANLVTNNALAYRVIVSIGNSSVTSSPALLAVQTAPVITSQPTSQTVVVGNTASFNITALGSAPLSYQWQANGGSGYTNLTDGGQIFGSGTNALTISNLSSNWALSYRVIVTNSIGSITSSVASLTVYPNILNINVDFGSGATQSGAAVVGASGDVWNAVSATTGTIKNTANATLSGVGLTLANSGVFTDTGGTAMDAASTALMQDYAYGNNSSVTVSLTGLSPYINSPFTLVVYSAGDNSGQGGSFTLTGATGGNASGALNTSGISRQISAGPGVAYNTFNGTLTNGTLTFTCSAINGQQFTEVNGFQLRFAPATNDPSLLVAPVSQTVPSGSTASFNVTAGGTAPFYYQWQAYSGTGFTNLTNGGQISGVNTNVLTITGVTASYVQPNWNWAGNYRVIVTNSVGSITSSPATLVVAATGVYVPPGGNANSAILAAYSAGGGTVNLGAGNYGAISMWANVTLNGAGSNTVITSVTDGTDDGSGFYRDNMTVQNLLIDGGLSCSAMSVGQIVGAGVVIGGYSPEETHNITFRNVEIKNTGMAMQIINVAGVHLYNCNFHDNCYPSGFDHSIYFTGDYDVEMYNCISSWCRAGDGAHLDFSSNIGVPNIFSQCEFNGTAGLGILNQNYNGSGNDVHFNGCKFQFNGQSGGDGDGIDTDLAGYVQASRLEFNHGYGANIRDSVGLFYDYFNGNSTDLYYSYGPVAAISSGSTPNSYDAVLADGVTGVNNTADWSTIYNGAGSATEGVVDFNANHSTNGLLNWSIVSSTVNGSRPLTIHYSNGTSTNLTMAMIVNGGATNLLTFPPTGAWTTYSTINTSATLTTQNNQVKMQVAYPGATSPELSSLVVSDSVPTAPAAPTGLTYLALTNAPKFDSSEWIQLSWNQVPGATYYDIQRNGLWIAINVPTNSFTDVHVGTSGAAFNYNVIAVNAGGSTGSSITAYSLTGFPISLSATANGPGSIGLSCNASYNAQYYNVYRATNANGPFIEIATNVGTSYTDNTAPGGTDYYYMTADNGLTESLPSPTASATVATLVLSITNEPTSQTNSVGANVSFTVGAVGYPVLTYQWQATNSATGGFTNLVNGGSISGATNATLTLTGITTNQALAYQVIVTNYQGSVTSSPATTLTVNLSPNITNQPASQNIFGGRNASFIVGAVGLAPLSYQWQSGPVGGPYANLGNGGKFSGATSNVLTIASVTTNQMQAYRVIVSNSYGSVTSSPAALTVQTTLLIDVDVGGGALQTGAAVLGTAGDVAWNSYSSVNASSLSNLHDSGSNTLTGVGLNVSTGLAYGNTVDTNLDAATTPLMQDFLFNNGPNLTTSVTGLAAYNNCPYTLVVYAAGTTYSGAQAALVTVTAGSAGTTPASGICTSTSRKISLGIGVAYQTFTGILTNSTLTFTLAAGSSGGYNLNGFQLQVIAPAPTVSANANLTSLALSSALTFTPSFSSSILTYAATEAYGNAPTVTVTNADLTATNQLIYSGATNGLASGAASAPLTLALGVTNVVQVQVTAQDGVTKQTYTVNVVEQPSQTKPVLTSGASGGALNLSWPADHLGYRLLTQTNNLNLGVSANINDWATVPGSTATNSISFPIISTNLNNYYRLVYP